MSEQAPRYDTAPPVLAALEQFQAETARHAALLARIAAIQVEALTARETLTALEDAQAQALLAGEPVAPVDAVRQTLATLNTSDRALQLAHNAVLASTDAVREARLGVETARRQVAQADCERLMAAFQTQGLEPLIALLRAWALWRGLPIRHLAEVFADLYQNRRDLFAATVGT